MDNNSFMEVPPEDEKTKYMEVLPETPKKPDDYSEVSDKDLVPSGTGVTVTLENQSPAKQFGPGDLGLVLAGGGGKGAYQIGVLKVLSDHGILKDVKAVAGTSIGAINAVLYAEGDFAKAYKAWDEIDMGVLFDIDLSMVASGKLYFSRDEMNRLMNNFVNYDMLSKSELEIYCGVAQELPDGKYRPEYMRLNGASQVDIMKILMASTAMPIVYDTVTINGKKYRDGGVSDNEPVKPLYDAGIRKFIVVCLDYSKNFTFSQYSDADFLIIKPSHDLGDVFSGTLNFHEQDKAIKRMLGERDAFRTIKTKIEKDENYIALESEFAVKDYEECVRQVQHEKKKADLEKSISSSFDYISEIEKKWGV